LKKFFERRNVKFKDNDVSKSKGGESDDSTKQQSFNRYHDIYFEE